MRRREFIKLSAKSAVLPAAAGLVHRAAASETVAPAGGTPRVLASYSAEDHRRRLESIRFCESSIRRCLRKHLIADYLPGQACYNLGEYPSQTPWHVSIGTTSRNWIGSATTVSG